MAFQDWIYRKIKLFFYAQKKGENISSILLDIPLDTCYTYLWTGSKLT